MDILSTAPPYPDVACGNTSIAFACITGSGNGIVRMKKMTGTTNHLFDYRLADNIVFNNILSHHAKQIYFEMVLIGDKSPLKISRSARNSCQLGCNTTAATTLGRTEGLVALKQNILDLRCNGIHILKITLGS